MTLRGRPGGFDSSLRPEGRLQKSLLLNIEQVVRSRFKLPVLDTEVYFIILNFISFNEFVVVNFDWFF